MIEDLRPFIEAKFPADPARSILFGHSFGGLFAANVFAHTPHAFAGYILGSVSVWADPAVVRRVLDAAAGAKGERIYLSVAALEDQGNPSGPVMMDGFTALAGAIASSSGIALRTQVFPGETHLSYYPRLVTDSFPFMLPPEIPLGAPLQPTSAEVTKRSVGVYDLPDGRKLTIARKSSDPMMTVQISGGPSMVLIPNGKDRFYIPAPDVNVVFDNAGANFIGVDGGALHVLRETNP